LISLPQPLFKHVLIPPVRCLDCDQFDRLFDRDDIIVSIVYEYLRVTARVRATTNDMHTVTQSVGTTHSLNNLTAEAVVCLAVRQPCARASDRVFGDRTYAQVVFPFIGRTAGPFVRILVEDHEWVGPC
jgi:hypothetical protein